MIILGPTYIERMSSGEIATDANRCSNARNIIGSFGSRLESNTPDFIENWNMAIVDESQIYTGKSLIDIVIPPASKK